MSRKYNLLLCHFLRFFLAAFYATGVVLPAQARFFQQNAENCRNRVALLLKATWEQIVFLQRTEQKLYR